MNSEYFAPFYLGSILLWLKFRKKMTKSWNSTTEDIARNKLPCELICKCHDSKYVKFDTTFNNLMLNSRYANRNLKNISLPWHNLFALWVCIKLGNSWKLHMILDGSKWFLPWYYNISINKLFSPSMVPSFALTCGRGNRYVVLADVIGSIQKAGQRFTCKRPSNYPCLF